jgi:hypothetical protein
MGFIIYFLSFFIYLLFGAIIINGFFNITRGSIEIAPDGTKEKKGKILRDWYLFWFMEHEGKLKVRYTGKRLEDLIHNYNVGAINKVPLGKFTNLYMEFSYPLGIAVVREFENRYNCKLIVRSINAGSNTSDVAQYALAIYQERPDYIFPWALRTSLASCITCHASWLGSIIFWLPIWLLPKEQLYYTFPFANHGTVWLVLTWVAYCISLACILNIVYNKMTNGSNNAR